MILIAGATGTTGSRIAARLVEQGFPILLGARNPARLEALASELGIGESAKRIIDLSIAEGVVRALKDVTVVVNATSPAASSALTLARAVTDRGLAYTDISGDVATTRTLLERLGPQARASKATLSPGAGFAPYCGITAVMLGREALPGARHVKIWYASPGFKPSRGTLASEPETLAGPCLSLTAGQILDTSSFGKVERYRGSYLLTRPMLDPLLASVIPGLSDCTATVDMACAEAYTLGFISRVARPLLRQQVIRRSLERRIQSIASTPHPATEPDANNRVTAEVSDGTRSCLITLEAPPIYEGTATSCASVAARLYQRPSLFGFVPPPFLFESGAAAVKAGALKLLHTAH